MDKCHAASLLLYNNNKKNPKGNSGSKPILKPTNFIDKDKAASKLSMFLALFFRLDVQGENLKARGGERGCHRVLIRLFSVWCPHPHPKPLINPNRADLTVAGHKPEQACRTFPPQL